MDFALWSAEKGRELLGGLVPAKEVERILVKDNLSLVTLEEPLFRPEDDVDEMKPFLPGRLPGFFVKEQNPAAWGVVVSRANGRSFSSFRRTVRERSGIGSSSRLEEIDE